MGVCKGRMLFYCWIAHIDSCVLCERRGGGGEVLWGGWVLIAYCVRKGIVAWPQREQWGTLFCSVEARKMIKNNLIT